MIAEYKRDMYRNYLMVLPEEKEPPGYEARMMQSNKIKGLLEMQIKSIDGQSSYYYDISSLQPCSEIYQKAKLTREQIAKFIQEIVETVEKGKEFLLTEDNFVLEPKYIYINPGNFKLSLCYFPGYEKEITVQLNSLFEFILDRVDYKDEQAVLLAYGLYKQNRSKAASVLELKTLLNEKPAYSNEQLKKEGALEQQHNEQRYSGQQYNEPLSGKLEKSTQANKSVKLREEKTGGMWIVMCVGAILLCVLIQFLLYRCRFFINPLGGQFETTRFALSLVLIGGIEASVLHFWYDKSNREQKKASWESTNKKENEKPNVFVNNGTEDGSGRIKIREKELAEPIIYKYDIETAPPPLTENTVLLLREDEVYGENSYCLSAVDFKIYQDILLLEFPFFIGKLKTKVDYTLEHAAISRFHAKIETDEEKLKFFLTDLNSMNGTFLNGRRLLANERVEILPGDRIAFAQINYIFNKI